MLLNLNFKDKTEFYLIYLKCIKLILQLHVIFYLIIIINNDLRLEEKILLFFP